MKDSVVIIDEHKTVGKGRPTPKREAQRKLNTQRAREARERNPNIMKLYDSFFGIPRKVKV